MSDTGEQRFGVLLTVAYDGADFAGFARQKQARTVQGELDGAVRAMDPTASMVRGTSRTDAGVHALAHPVAFDTSLDVPPRGWALGLRAHLAAEVSIVGAAQVVAGYDPRAHARKKTYRYLVDLSPVADPFLRGRAWRLDDWLNHERLVAEARALVGRHDFRAFRTSADQREDTVRTIFRADVDCDVRLGRLTVEIEGDRFLHRMVRIIVGTLVDVARGRLEPGAVERAFSQGERSLLGITAPPDGLYLARAELDDDGSAGHAEHMGQPNWPDQLTCRLTRGPF